MPVRVTRTSIRELRLAAAIAVTVLVLGAGSARAASVQVLAPATQRSRVTAGDGHVVWSVRDAASGRYRLMDRYRNVVRTLPLASSPILFDADLGRDPAGRTALVYARCTKPGGHLLSEAGGLSLADGGSGCAIRMLVLGRRADHAVDVDRPAWASDVMPRLNHGAIAFFRMPRRGEIASRARLMRRSARGRLTGVAGGPLDVVDQDSGIRWDDSDGPLGLAFDGGTLVWKWDAHRRPARHCKGLEPDPLAVTVFTARTGTARRTQMTDCPSNPRIQLGGVVAISPIRVMWTFRDTWVALAYHLVTIDRRTGAVSVSVLPLPAGTLLSLDSDGDTLYATLEDNESHTSVLAITP
jgi:hypothetical protein